MIRSFRDEELIETGGNRIRLAIDFSAIDAIQSMAEKEMPDILRAVLAGANCPVSVTIAVIWGLMRRHYPESTPDEAAGLMFGEDRERVGLGIADLLQRSFNLGAPKAKGENPPKRRGTSIPSLSNGSNSAALLPSSGGRRRGPTYRAWKAWPAPQSGKPIWRSIRHGTRQSSRSSTTPGSLRASMSTCRATISAHRSLPKRLPSSIR